jgi:hypothetical protein
MPSITVDSDASGDPYNFDIIDRQATHTALVDNDPTYGQALCCPEPGVG